MSIFDEINMACDLQDVEEQFGFPSFTWNGQSFGCLPNTLIDVVKGTDQGFDNNTDVRIAARCNQFDSDSFPSLGDDIIYLGYTLRIKQIEKPMHGVFWVFVTNAPGVK